MTHQEVRRQRIEYIKASIENAQGQGLEIDEKKLIACCCLEWNTTKRTILDYLEVLENAGIYKRRKE